MRFVGGILAIGLLASPVFGVIQVSLVPDSSTLYVGQQMQIYVWAQGTASGIASLGGDILGSGDDVYFLKQHVEFRQHEESDRIGRPSR